MPVVDTRPAENVAEGFVPGTINIVAGDSFLTWAGWLLPYDRPFGLIVDEQDADRTADELRLIGLDNVAGYWTHDAVSTWSSKSGALATLERLDVRGASEYEAGHIPGSRHIPLDYLRDRVDTVPFDAPALVYCQGVTRSPIAASLLTALGRRPIIELRDGFSGWASNGNATVLGPDPR